MFHHHPCSIIYLSMYLDWRKGCTNAEVINVPVRSASSSLAIISRLPFVSFICTCNVLTFHCNYPKIPKYTGCFDVVWDWESHSCVCLLNRKLNQSSRKTPLLLLYFVLIFCGDTRATLLLVKMLSYFSVVLLLLCLLLPVTPLGQSNISCRNEKNESVDW